MDGHDILHRIKVDDPDLVDIAIGRRGDCFPLDEDWEGLGRDIGKSKFLRMLSLDIAGMTDEDLTVFLKELSANTSLRDLDLTDFYEHEYLGEEALRSFVPIFKNNKLIEHLEICCTLPCIPLLASALTEANSLKSFELYVPELDEDVEGGQSIINALSGHSGLEELILHRGSVGRDVCLPLADMLQSHSKLTVLHLDLGFPLPWMGRDPSKTINSEHASVLATGLAGNSTLRYLRLAHLHALSEKAWQDVFHALKSPSSKLEKLSLFDSNAASVAGIHLADALENNRTLKVLDLGRSKKIAMASWLALSEHLRGPKCQLKEIDLQCCNLNDDSIECFSDAMADASSVKKLVLCGNRDITPAGWVAFSTALQSPTSALESLNLSNNKIGDEAMGILSTANISAVKELRLGDNRTITSPGWAAFSTLLQSPVLALESLDLSNNKIGDESIEILCNSIANNNKLKKLDFGRNYFVSGEGWRTSIPRLLNAKSSLEKLDLRNNCIDHDTLVFCLPALANNVTLKEFLVDNTEDFLDNEEFLEGDFAQVVPLSTDSWAAFSLILCNQSSIMDTYQSNHTLQRLTREGNESVLPDVIQTLLFINRHMSRSQAAHYKIVPMHFREGFIAPPFKDMDIRLLPHAIAWMSRAVGANEASHFYGFVKDFLFQKVGDRTDGQGSESL